MSSSLLCQTQKEHLNKLQEEYLTVLGQMSRVLEDREELRLNRQAEALEKQITEWEEKVKRCETGANDTTFQQRYRFWEEHISDIDYTEAFKIAHQIVDRFTNSDGGEALFLLQNTHMLEGRWCVRWLRQQFKSITADFKPYPIKPTAAGRMDTWTFLSRMGEYLKCTAPTTSSGTAPDETLIRAYTQDLHETLYETLHMGSIVFIEVCTGVTLAYQNDFLIWFLEEFWKPLIQSLPKIRRNAPLVSIVGVITSQVPVRTEDPVPIPCCTPEIVDACQFLELPLRRWEKQEIQRWLVRFSGLTPHHIGHPNITDVIAQMANAIYLMGDNGQPNAVYSALFDQLRQFYKTH